LKCQYCGKDELLPFKCQYCQGLFCAEHRLPENHNCSQIGIAKAPKEAMPMATDYEHKVTFSPTRNSKFRFSPTEIEHLLISALLVMGVGISIMFSSLGGALFSLQGLLIVAALIFIGIFLLHEIAHKLVAQHYGLWAEFRLTPFGALITMISIISPFKIISPGAVMIAGYGEKETVGKTAVAGPLVNIALSVVSLMLAFIIPSSSIYQMVALFSALFNAFVAVFNLLPVAILDGLKVFHWSKLVWVGCFAASIALLVTIFVVNPSLFS
jgi:Zn-dependent protease